MNSEVTLPKESPTQWGVVGTLAWGVFIAMAFTILQGATMLLILLSADEGQVDLDQMISSPEFDGNLMSVSTIVTSIICSLLILVAIKLKKGSCIGHYLGLKGVSIKLALRWVLLMAGFLAVFQLLTAALGRPTVNEFMLTIYITADPVWLLWFALVVAAPVFEELFFRGFLMKGFAASWLGPIGAILITSALWAAIHTQYDYYEIAFIFLMGCLLGSARHLSGSVLLTIGLHALVNLIATIEAAFYVSANTISG